MDIKRTILWVIFSMALVLLYDNWQRANGHASMFFPSANTQQQAAPAGGASGAAAQGDVPKANASATAGASAPGAVPGAPQAAAQPTGEKVVVTTDDLRAEICPAWRCSSTTRRTASRSCCSNVTPTAPTWRAPA
jgi:YidC/Oxa1 family membrane protein insertase